MKILMIGGTGNISIAVTDLLIKHGHELYLYCLGNGLKREKEIAGAVFKYGDINDEEAVVHFLEDHTFDVVVDWTVMLPEELERDIRLFTGKTAQYILISSASCYQHPPKHYIATEETPLENRFWEYSRNKIACEIRLMTEYQKNGFPATIVRPSLTFGDSIVPYVLTSWNYPWTLIERMKKGKRIIVPGDGTSLWTITHNTDFAKGIAGLMGNKDAVGEPFHITSDEVLTWEDIAMQMAEVIGVALNPVHISSEFIVKFMPDQVGNLFGDKNTSAVFDNSKLKKYVPGFKASMTFKEGFQRTYDYLKAHPELQVVDEAYEKQLDRVIAAFDHGMGYTGV